MKLFFKIVVCTLILSLHFLSSKTTAAPLPDIQADQKSFEFSTGSWILQGNVIVRSDDWIAKADYVKVHPFTYNLWAEGNVTLTWGGLEIKSHQLNFKSSTQIAQLSGGVQLSYDGFSISANEGNYNLTKKEANLFGNCNFNPKTGGFLKSDSVYLDVVSYAATFTSSVRFELYQANSGKGVAGVAQTGSYLIQSETATFGTVDYKLIPSGSTHLEKKLIFSSYN